MGASRLGFVVPSQQRHISDIRDSLIETGISRFWKPRFSSAIVSNQSVRRTGGELLVQLGPTTIATWSCPICAVSDRPSRWVQT